MYFLHLQEQSARWAVIKRRNISHKSGHVSNTMCSKGTTNQETVQLAQYLHSQDYSNQMLAIYQIRKEIEKKEHLHKCFNFMYVRPCVSIGGVLFHPVRPIQSFIALICSFKGHIIVLFHFRD